MDGQWQWMQAHAGIGVVVQPARAFISAAQRAEQGSTVIWTGSVVLMEFSSCYLAALLVLVALAAPHRLGAAAAAGEGSEPNRHVVSINSLLPNTVCTATEEPASPARSSALAVVHKHGPCSPLQSRVGAPSHAEIVRRDQDRVDAIHRKVAAVTAAASKGGVSLLANWGKSLGSANYVTSLRLGTPATDLVVELDTGSVQSWVQCKPCADCYEQHDPVFDPTRSSTFSAIPCGAPECQDLGSSSQNCSSDKKCTYQVSYDDDSYTAGDLARDTLTLSSLSPADTVTGFVFGCGHNNAGTFGEIDGLLGLGRGKASLSSQVAARYGAGFSYCLPSSPSAAGYLSFGGADAAPADVQFTEMVIGQDSTAYYLDLTGMLVAGRAIKVPPSVFVTAAGTIIDSGTAFSRLPQAAYAALRSAFRSAMGRYRYKRAPSSTIFDTCYDFTGHETVQIPSVALVFADGATVHLHPSGVLYTWNDASQMCLAFVPNHDEASLGILGNTQQRTLAVVYDVGNHKVGFGANGCA